MGNSDLCFHRQCTAAGFINIDISSYKYLKYYSYFKYLCIIHGVWRAQNCHCLIFLVKNILCVVCCCI